MAGHHAVSETAQPLPLGAVPSIFHGNELHAVAPEAVAAALSLIGDCLLIGTFASSSAIRKVVALRLIVPLAVANLFGCVFFFLLILGDAAVDKDPVLCSAATAGVWYFMWAAWLWTIPYAKFVRDVFCGVSVAAPSHVQLDGRVDGGGRLERALVRLRLADGSRFTAWVAASDLRGRQRRNARARWALRVHAGRAAAGSGDGQRLELARELGRRRVAALKRRREETDGADNTLG